MRADFYRMPSEKINSSTFQIKLFQNNCNWISHFSSGYFKAREMKLLPGLSVISVGSAVQDRVSIGYINVGDECWCRNVIVTHWEVWDIDGRFYTLQKSITWCHQDLRTFTVKSKHFLSTRKTILILISTFLVKHWM